MKVLLATDGSEGARAAADFLAAFPFPAERDVIVTTVLGQVLDPAQIRGLRDDRREAFEALRRDEADRAQALLDNEIERLRCAGWSGSTLLRIGHPAEEILKAVDELGVDLVVLGSHGESGVRRFLLGSVSDQVLAGASCSALVVKPGAMAPIRDPAAAAAQRKTPWHIVLAHDGSPSSIGAAEWCAALPLQHKGEVRAITVLPLVRIFRQDIRQRLSWIWQEKKAAARAALDTVAERLRASLAGVSSELLEDEDVAQAILDAASAFSADLIVLGHKGEGRVKQILLGSVISRIAHHSHCAVLAVRERRGRG